MSAGEGEPGHVFDARMLRRLVQHLEGTDVDEVEIQGEDFALFLRRDPGLITVANRERRESGPAHEGTPIGAPLTGIFYLRPSPEQPAFVRVGDMVEVGQVVGLIETMKLFNEVTSELAGEVTAIGPDGGDLIEAGQPLIWIRPRNEGEQP